MTKLTKLVALIKDSAVKVVNMDHSVNLELPVVNIELLINSDYQKNQCEISKSQCPFVNVEYSVIIINA